LIPRYRSIASKLAPTFEPGRTQTLCSLTIHCGSELAREGVLSGNVDVGCAGAFASKPAPTGFCVCRMIRARRMTCGSELARDGVLTGNVDVGCAGPFASKPAPTGFCVCRMIRARRITCGSELARDGVLTGATTKEPATPHPKPCTGQYSPASATTAAARSNPAPRTRCAGSPAPSANPRPRPDNGFARY